MRYGAYLTLASMLVAFQFTSSPLPEYSLFFVLYCLLFPQALNAICYILRKDSNITVIFMLELLQTGFIVSITGFSVVPVLIMALMISFHFIVSRGFYGLTTMYLSFALGNLLGYLVLDVPLDLDTPFLVSVVGITLTALYLALYGYYIFLQSFYLQEVQRKLSIEKEKAAALARNLSKYLSPQIWQMIFSGKKTVKLETQRKKLTIFFSDIKEFTLVSEELEAEALTDLLNSYFTEMAKIALKYGGTIDKFVGDCIMIFFGDPNSKGTKKDAIAAVSMAIEMRDRMKSLRDKWRAQGIEKPLEVRMGLSTGFCTVGNFGAATRMDYTIIGREVNLASRLESAASAGSILISYETYSLVKDHITCRDSGEIIVRGFSRPIRTYEVIGFKQQSETNFSYFEHQQVGFSLYLDSGNVSNKEAVIEALKEATQRLENQ
ncbi:adenylate/guanylate cyclase domain-containing protein [Pseudomonas sp. F1_0610]|uniref:adenylate/guanylate cyclase domain-containing protein n=1 Tax=Pseudomonas sp. F1_0610 TaxID=3114284 RepID=UPI0039C4642E